MNGAPPVSEPFFNGFANPYQQARQSQMMNG